MVITGGYYSLTEVTEYSEAGPTGRDLPQLQQGRWLHGCSYFDNDEGTKVSVDNNFGGAIHHVSDTPRHWRLHS